jgi:hypothetical protein
MAEMVPPPAPWWLHVERPRVEHPGASVDG